MANAHLVISGTIIAGRRVGRQLGFPTINLPSRARQQRWGVYCALARVDKHWYVGVSHLGPASTYGHSTVLCETFLLGSPKLSKPLTGRQATVILIKKLRPTKKFKSPKLMQKQIKKDVKSAEKFFNLN